MKKPLMALMGLATVAAVLPFGSQADAQARTRIGTLSCDVAPGVGFILGSRKAVDCVYRSAGGRYHEHYVGSIGRFGIDIGFTDGGRLGWAVFAPSRPGPGALAGTYVGAGTEVTVIGGVGANVLVGGFERSVTLQPLSFSAQTGANVAVAVSSLDLNPAGPPVRHRYHKHRRHHRHHR